MIENKDSLAEALRQFAKLQELRVATEAQAKRIEELEYNVQDKNSAIYILEGRIAALEAENAELKRHIVGAMNGCACINDMPGDNHTCTHHQFLRRVAIDVTRKEQHG